MKYVFTILAMVLLWFGLARITDYDGRMKEYNYHMCVEVYGLNEECK